jgi:hypothetical protein
MCIANGWELVDMAADATLPAITETPTNETYLKEDSR